MKKTQQKISIIGLTNFLSRQEHCNYFSIFHLVPIFSYFFIMMNLDLISSILFQKFSTSQIVKCKIFLRIYFIHNFLDFPLRTPTSFHLIFLSFFEPYGNISNALEKEHIFFFLLAGIFPVYFSPKLFYLVRGSDSPFFSFFSHFFSLCNFKFNFYRR